jgi:hypothetical protein
MNSRSSLLIAGASLAAGLAGVHAAHAGSHCRRAAPDRGIAILSPVECPDPCDVPVGGCYRYTPYYPGYAPDRRCLILYGQTPWQYGGPVSQPMGNRPSDYGAFSGASRDEASLLRLGGNGAGGRGTYRPYSGAGDVIDQIHGRRP